MEILGNTLTPYQPSSPERGNSGRTSADQRFVQEQAAAQKRATGNSRQEQVTRESSVRTKGNADYTEILQERRGNPSSESFRRATPPAQDSLGVKRALDAYQNTANDLVGSGIDLLPRVDRYV